MNSIHTALQTPAKQKIMGLGPVEVSSAYPISQTKTGKAYRNLMIRDGSGSCKLALWGSASSLPIEKGDTITLKGTLTTNEYNGTISLNAESVTLGEGGGSAGNASTPIARGFSTPSAKDGQIIRQNALAHSTALVIACGVKDVFQAQDLVIDLAQRFAHYSETGETKLPVPDDKDKEEIEQPY